MAEIDRVLYDVDLVGEGRGDVDRSIGDDQGILVAGNVHHKAMADPARGANTSIAHNHGTHQLVRVKAALHEGFGLPLPDEPDRLGGRVMAVRRLLDLEARDISFRLSSRVVDAGRRSDEDRV